MAGAVAQANALRAGAIVPEAIGWALVAIRTIAADVASRWRLYSLRWLVRRRLCFRLRVHAEHLPQEAQKEGKCHEDAEDKSIASRLDILSARQRARGSARRLLRVKGRRADHEVEKTWLAPAELGGAVASTLGGVFFNKTARTYA